MGLGAPRAIVITPHPLVSRMLRLEQSRVSTSEGGGQLCGRRSTTDYLRSSVLWARD